MRQNLTIFLLLIILIAIPIIASASNDQKSGDTKEIEFPRSLDSYHDQEFNSVFAVLKNRIFNEPFNLAAFLIFLFAIIHTFLANKFTAISHKLEKIHKERIKQGTAKKESVHFGSEIIHFLGEVETIFGLWATVLFFVIIIFYSWDTVIYYFTQKVNYTEPAFVFVIMALASTRPILKLAESIMQKFANLIGGTLSAWWLTILTIGPLLGSLITEPAAMTISAFLLANKFYDLQPGNKFKYATIGLLFVNISVGGTLTHFAAPPVLMVSHVWHWSFSFMILNYGWKAIIGILIANFSYYLLFKKELAALQKKHAIVQLKEKIQKKYLKREHLEDEFGKIEIIISEELEFDKACAVKCDDIKTTIKAKLLKKITNDNIDINLFKEAFNKKFEEIKLKQMRKILPGLLAPEQRAPFFDPDWDKREDNVPAWVTLVHVFFMAWTVINSHNIALFIVGLLFFLGFSQATSPFQNRIDLKPPLLVGFFLGGLVIHGGVQAWWLAPVLGTLKEFPLMIGATILTAFNDNASITYLSTLVPHFAPSLKYAVVAGAVTGGGLTIIANAPNPAGQSILKNYFNNGISPLALFKAALLPTVILFLCFAFLNF